MTTSKDGATSLKLEAEWTDVEDEEDLRNSEALNSMFNGMDKNMFRLINTCSIAKEAYEILKTVHEDASKVCMSRL